MSVEDRSLKLRETHYLPSGSVSMVVDVYDNVELDTFVEINVDLWVAGADRMQFLDRLRALLSEFRI